MDDKNINENVNEQSENINEPSDKIQFFIPIRIPTVTAQERRVLPSKTGGKPIFFDTPEIANARAKYIAYLGQYKPVNKYLGAVSLRVVWCFQATVKHRHGEWKISKPDTDNMIKLFKDCMTKVGFWKDDAQVAREIQEKRYCDIEGIYVQVSPLDAPLVSMAEKEV